MNPALLTSILQRVQRNIASSPYLHLAATCTITFCLVITGAFAILYINVDDLIKGWQENIRVVAYISSGLAKGRVESLQQRLAQLSGVEEICYVSKDEAMGRLRRQMKHRSSLLDGLDENPLPASFEIRLTGSCKSWQCIGSLVRKIKGFSQIDDVEYAKAWLHRFSGFIAFFRLATIVIGSLIFAATVFVCANTMRLTLYAKQEELEIMRLVGATDRFIKTPLYIQNLIEGLLGGVAAAGLLFAAYKFFVAKVQTSEALLSTYAVRFLPLTGTAGLLCAGILIGWFGSYLSSRQFLQP